MSRADIHDTINELFTETRQKENELIERIIREHAEPPIIGEITKKGLDEREITLAVYTMRNGSVRKWIEQRGVRIGPVFFYDMR